MIPHGQEYIVQLPQPAGSALSRGSTAEAGPGGMPPMPSMLLPVLLVLFAGLCLLNHYRRRYAM